MRADKPVKLRLSGIDAPEKSQPYGVEAQKSLAEMTMGKWIRVITRARDDYGRTVADVIADGVDVNHEQVRRGLAWEYSRFHNRRELLVMQRQAQQQKRGLWAGDNVIEPALWRKQHANSLAIPRTPNPLSGCSGKRYCTQMTS
jgi:endonuclease YncB( thermonuclease family)